MTNKLTKAEVNKLQQKRLGKLLLVEPLDAFADWVDCLQGLIEEKKIINEKIKEAIFHISKLSND